ncbi:hypothetical protein PG993_013253 [Apiospora rasikravindrae]|uniref:Zn(2)-C6 fungal-type domain-containing protein n=1 Tax=Apiospora rasikravindrae TaxID=990691 RepID=A0ABR1RX62_9PEZI
MGSRKSRRSACDLCRLYKLRCDRDERHGKSCGRCDAANQACEITLGRPVTQAPSDKTKERENLLKDNTSTATASASAAPMTSLRPCHPSGQLGRSSVSASGGGALVPRTQCTSATAGPLASLAERVSFEDSVPVFPDHLNYTENLNMDFSMPIPGFDSGNFSFLFPDTKPGLSYAATAEMPDMSNSELHSTLGSTSLEQPLRQLHSSADFAPGPSHRTMDDHELPAIDSKSLTQLSLEIIEDYELLRTSSPLNGQPETVPHHCSSTEQHRPFNRMLSQAAKLWDIIKSMCASDDREGELGHSISPAHTTMPKRTDQVLIMTLITTYAHLMRNCRGIFMRLLLALQSDASAKLILPSLQFGTFQLSNSLPIQVKVLIDITSGMLLRITNELGISPVGVTAGPTQTASTHDEAETRLPFLTDPIAVSLRDTILSQEYDLPENEQHMSLHGIMVDILRLVDQKFK